MIAERLSIVVQQPSSCEFAPPREQIRTWIESALKDAARGELTVRIVAEDESAELNARYRGRQGPTNVLAFPAELEHPASAGEVPPCGDLVVCAPLLAREAAEQGKSPEAHWAHVVIHGALHLIGYDHETEQQARMMEARERALLEDFGFPDPYREHG